MVWCFSTRAAVVTVLITHPCVPNIYRLLHEYQVTHICISKLGHHQFRWQSSVQMTSRLLASNHHSQCWLLVNWTLDNKFSKIWIKIQQFSYKKINLKHLQNGSDFIWASKCYTSLISSCSLMVPLYSHRINVGHQPMGTLKSLI